MAIKELERPNSEKELKSFLGAIQYLSKYINNLSAQTDSLRQLLKKDTEKKTTTEWIWTEEHTKHLKISGKRSRKYRVWPIIIQTIQT